MVSPQYTEMFRDTEKVLAYFLAFVMCCIIGYLVSLSNEDKVIIYLLVVLFLFLMFNLTIIII